MINDKKYEPSGYVQGWMKDVVGYRSSTSFPLRIESNSYVDVKLHFFAPNIEELNKGKLVLEKQLLNKKVKITFVKEVKIIGQSFVFLYIYHLW